MVVGAKTIDLMRANHLSEAQLKDFRNDQETYEELNKKLPSLGDQVVVPDGRQGTVHSVSVLRQLVKVVIEENDQKEITEYPVDDLEFRPRKKKGKGQNQEQDRKENREPKEKEKDKEKDKDKEPKGSGEKKKSGEKKGDSKKHDREPGSKKRANR